MITITSSGSSIVFEFDDNQHYLQNGTIEVPVNSLMLVTDDSGMFTFKKSSTNDIFLSGLYTEIGMTKDELIAFYKENMVGEQGGSSSGITSGEVQTMIDESISGKADSSAVTEDIAAAVSGKVDTSVFETYSGSVETALSGKVDTSAITSSVTSASTDSELPTAKAVYDAIQEGGITSGEVQSMIDESTSGITTDVNTISGKVNTNEEVTARALNTLNGELSGKADSSAVTESINAAVSGKLDTSVFETYSGSVETALSGKQDTLSAGTNITISGNVISAEGGGKAIEAGRGISITTGETADTVSFNLPISADTDGSVNEILVGNNNTIGSDTNKNIVIGDNNTTFGQGSGRRYSGATIIGYNNNVGCVGMQTDRNDWSSVIGRRNEVNGGNSYIIGVDNNFYNFASKKDYHYIIGVGNDESSIAVDTQNVFVFGAYNKITKSDEFALGKYNTSSSDGTTSGNTFFAIGNGTADNARHNAFEIRQNGDIYITSGGTDIKLQDNLGGGGTVDQTVISGSTNAVSGGAVYDQLGGLKLQQITQADYDALVSGGTVDSSTIYFIVNNS